MFGKNLKITTKLTISTAVFLVPLAVMFYLLISVSFDSINRYKNEMKGLACLRPAVSLMQIIPQYMRISLDGSSGGKEKISENVTNQLSELNRACQKNFGWSSPRQLADNWNILLNGTEEQQLAAYEQCVKILRAFIAEIANEAGLITDPELENIYLALTATSEMPLVQERIAGLENIFRRHKNRTISEGQLDELKSYATLLVDSDFDSVQTALNAVNDARTKSGQTEIIRVFESPSKAYHDAANSLRSELTRIIAELEEKIDAAARARTRNLREPVLDLNSVSMITGASGLLNNAIYRLQNTAFDRLETLLDARLENLQGHLVRSVILSAAATLAAFVIVFFTTLGIRQSARTAGRVFKTLEKNDLSITVTARAQDELGELLASLGAFLEKLKTAFASFNQNALMVSTAVHDLSASSKEITTTANEQSASVAEIVSTMENSKNLSEQVAVKTGEVADLAAKTQEFSQRGAELRNANQVMMQKIREQNAKIIEEIQNLADMLSRIDESVQLIDTIADQTKLIAFNAALEASSAGEAGARFAVVASEIRRFAHNVVESVVEIKEKITELQDASQVLITEANNGSRQIDSGYERMVEQKTVFENIVEISQNVATRSQQISNLSKQQELASAQIFTALKEISAGVKQFVTATASTSATAEGLNAMSVELKETLAKYHTEK